MSKESASLDDRIADTFAGDETSQTIAALLQEVQKTSADAKVTSEAAEQRALNPRLRPAEVDAARKEMEDANFRSKRMDAAAEQLTELLETAKRKEAAVVRKAEYEAAKAERDQLVKDLPSYEEHAKAIVALMDRITENNARLERVNVGCDASTWLHTAERLVRQSNQDVSLARTVRIPALSVQGWSHQTYLWPPASRY